MLSKQLHDELLIGTMDLESSMAYISALREIADAELTEGFAFDRDSYAALASTLVAMAESVGGAFAAAYCHVAQRVQQHAETL